MTKKRPRLTGEALDDFFTPTERARTPPPYDRKYTRRTYRVTEEIHQDLKSVAENQCSFPQQIVQAGIIRTLGPYHGQLFVGLFNFPLVKQCARQIEPGA